MIFRVISSLDLLDHEKFEFSVFTKNVQKSLEKNLRSYIFTRKWLCKPLFLTPGF